eukprot:TRINITY_DN24016_c0_g2_i1.p1 TRINITY_DN24016_c0_g2~~TRINITY_DN24016_c0_g2_i1.p1  ORF type:complete len:411 (+),score=51.02 TRINITY_DN24016_c0_g2_i1:65-1297(+)
MALACIHDRDCGWHARCEGSFCQMKDFFESPLVDLSLGAAAFCIAGISLAAGVGGGGLYVPLLMIVLSLDIGTATALSQSMLLGGAVAALVYNVRQTHPNSVARPLIDFELACLLGASLMGGARIGTLLHAGMPPVVLLSLLVVVLFDASRKSWKSIGRLTSREQTAQISINNQVSLELEAQQVSIETQYRLRSRAACVKLCGIWVTCLLLVLSRSFFVDSCSGSWWFLTFLAVTVMGGYGLYCARALGAQRPLDSTGIDFGQQAVKLAITAFFAGILAAMCGIGGGMVMGPILVEMQVLPAVSSATTATTLLVLSSSTGIVLLLQGVAPWEYAFYLSFMTMLGAMVGKVSVGSYVSRTGKQSTIVWLMLIVTVTSCVLMLTLGILRSWYSWEHNGNSFKFHAFCVESDG